MTRDSNMLQVAVSGSKTLFWHNNITAWYATSCWVYTLCCAEALAHVRNFPGVTAIIPYDSFLRLVSSRMLNCWRWPKLDWFHVYVFSPVTAWQFRSFDNDHVLQDEKESSFTDSQVCIFRFPLRSPCFGSWRWSTRYGPCYLSLAARLLIIQPAQCASRSIIKSKFLILTVSVICSWATSASRS